MAVREPAVAGTFYPAETSKLKSFCATHLSGSGKSRPAKAVLLPHAGYIYSGITACKVLKQIQVPDSIFLIGPNHWGTGAGFAWSGNDHWRTPLGDVAEDRPFCESLAASCRDFQEDPFAHVKEHSLEVEIPLLQTRNPSIRIIPVIVRSLNLNKARDVALCLGRALSEIKEKPLVVVSSDMNHYENDRRTREKDRHAVEAIQKLDAEALADAVQTYQISMCGFVPAFMLLVMKDFLGITKAELVDYRTSADASGDTERVVGYAGFIFS